MTPEQMRDRATAAIAAAETCLAAGGVGRFYILVVIDDGGKGFAPMGASVGMTQADIATVLHSAAGEHADHARTESTLADHDGKDGGK